jgi:hypothetical protein
VNLLPALPKQAGTRWPCGRFVGRTWCSGTPALPVARHPGPAGTGKIQTDGRGAECVPKPTMPSVVV